MKLSLLLKHSLLTLVGSLAISTPALAQSTPPSNDEELLKRLDAEPVDDYDRELFGGAPNKPGPKAPEEEGPRNLEKRLQGELGKAAEKESDDPLLNVARRMREVQTRMVKQDSGSETQEAQRRIAADLQRLIEEKRKSGSQSQSGAKPQGVTSRAPIGQGDPQAKNPGQGGDSESKRGNPTEAGKDPRKAAPGKVDMAEARKTMRELWWAHLPERERQQMLQQSGEEFLPKYELLIEEYFRRLAEESAKPDAGR